MIGKIEYSCNVPNNYNCKICRFNVGNKDYPTNPEPRGIYPYYEVSCGVKHFFYPTESNWIVGRDFEEIMTQCPIKFSDLKSMNCDRLLCDNCADKILHDECPIINNRSRE